VLVESSCSRTSLDHPNLEGLHIHTRDIRRATAAADEAGPVISTDDTTRLLDSCKGSGFMNLRDQAMIRLYCNTGARLPKWLI
jgi:site-specific recombinase XerD